MRVSVATIKHLAKIQETPFIAIVTPQTFLANTRGDCLSQLFLFFEGETINLLKW